MIYLRIIASRIPGTPCTGGGVDVNHREHPCGQNVGAQTKKSSNSSPHRRSCLVKSRSELRYHTDIEELLHLSPRACNKNGTWLNPNCFREEIESHDQVHLHGDRVSEREEITNDVRANLPEAMIKLNAGTHLRQNKVFGKGPGECNDYRI